MENKGKMWLINAVIVNAVIVIAVIVIAVLGIYVFNHDGISNTNVVNTQKLAEVENQEIENKQVFLNEAIETSMISTKISPNAIIIEKRYYKACDHLIREVIDIPKNLVNQTEDEVKKQYSGWKIEGYSAGEIVVYKEFKGICNEHYVVKEHNGILAVYIEDENGITQWKEDTEIEVQYLPEDDIAEFKVGVSVVGKTNLNSFLENYE